MKYTRKQLIRGMQEYQQEAIIEDFEDGTGTFEDAVCTVDYLIEIMNKQKTK